ncbi:Serpentine Receptor, class Z [Caenorhabditis elegans]|uniref:Serpentine Receptor, class Z n=1 Tax=Caenorhabditis elegans TaxID=6239 RepID=U3UB87_CAEEL|nr:Serpentine Receptor, class Z [Caenorhabditis elegans]CCD64036.2 Serpentine Receptor, class Z [Caenorhabditis elegans]|eukprot:NP_001294209.1 Serpentine Receptor, class Z [Caenorhabditis elegans]
MNFSDSTVVDDSSLQIPDSVNFIFMLLFSMLMFCYLLVFPIFKYICKINEEQDQKDKLYPVIIRLFAMVKTFYYLFIPLTASVIIANKPKFGYIKLLIILICYFLFIIAQAFNIVVFLVAVEKWSGHMFPNFAQYVTSAREVLLYKTWILYIFLVLTELGIYVGISCTVSKSALDYVFGSILFCMAMSSVLSALLHLSILNKIRKLAYLESTQLNNLYIYVFWLTITVVVFKAIYIPFFTIIYLIFLRQFSLYVLIVVIGCVEGLTTPFIIETVYIICNIGEIYTVDGKKITEVLRLYLK